MSAYGVKFNESGKVYFFEAENLNIHDNVCVIVETEKGLQYGKVVRELEKEEFQNIKGDLKKILRLTTKDDYKQHLANLKDAEQALKNAQKFADDLGLEMRFLSSNFTFDRKQLLFQFTASERVDFRELTRKLAGVYKTRIELMQIGARDKACVVGGIGQCGRKLCCASFLHSLESVSMNMAKTQNLSLNPTKINGACGRLLCCLAYEEDMYQECLKGLPLVGDNVIMDNIKGKVINVDILNRKIKVDTGDEIKEVDMNNESNK